MAVCVAKRNKDHAIEPRAARRDRLIVLIARVNRLVAGTDNIHLFAPPNMPETEPARHKRILAPPPRLPRFWVDLSAASVRCSRCHSGWHYTYYMVLLADKDSVRCSRRHNG